jgi:predicted acyltransferase
MTHGLDSSRSRRLDTGNAAPAGGRVASVDALRGLTILLMVFVNDLGHGAPSWMHHIQPPDADGMTLADVVFPSFLFIVGVSIPLAFERAEAAGRSKLLQFLHVLVRTASLLIMGVIERNSESERTLGPLWSVLAFTALLLAWCSVPRERGQRHNIVIALRILGAVSLAVLLALFRREPGTAEVPFRGPIDNWVWMRAEWWGILGLIGWAYLTVSLFVLLLGWRREWLMGGLALLMLLHLAFNHGGLFTHMATKAWLGPAREPLAALARGIDAAGHYVSFGEATGSLAAITMAGCLLGTILRRDSEVASPRARVGWALLFATGLFVAGCLTDTFEGINKIAATPTWCLWSAAIACGVWILLYLLLDVGGLAGPALPLRAAGANPLVAYFLHPILVEGIGLAGLGGSVLAYKQSADPWVVVGGSIGMAAVVCLAAGLLGRLGLRVRL